MVNVSFHGFQNVLIKFFFYSFYNFDSVDNVFHACHIRFVIFKIMTAPNTVVDNMYKVVDNQIGDSDEGR